MGNATGNYNTTIVLTMQAFDRLPAPLREVHRNALIYWATEPYEQMIRKGLEVPAAIEKLIREDVLMTRKAIREEWGIQYEAYIEAQKPRTRRSYLDAPPRGYRKVRLAQARR